LQKRTWIRTAPLCIGGIGDQDYLSETKIFKKQKMFASRGNTSDELGSNVLDKGYRSTLAAQLEGQQCFQQEFAICDRKFNGERTLHSAAVAVVSSGNGRAVKHVKNSWFLKRGGSLSNNVDLVMLDNIWLEWGFRANFICSPVHYLTLALLFLIQKSLF